MSNIYITLEQNLTANEVIRKEPINFKGAPSVTFVLTGITEESNAALTLDVNYGDGTSNVFSQKDLVFNYKTNSIFNEMLYGKVGGTIMNTYDHTYVPSTSSFFTNLTAQFLIYFNNGLYANIFQPITLIRESYYDDIEKLGILNTQMVGLSTSNTVANLQSKFNKRSYITYLDNS
tara:strand:+ start:1735 stop:2262 length:528 start_codon:yes stop_codon:yes gene_type:complete